MELPRTPREAKCLGVSKYYTGTPCSKGHMTHRYAHNATCVTCAAEASTKSRPRSTKTPLTKSQRSRKKTAARKSKPKAFFAHSFINRTRKRAAKKGIPFNITAAYIVSIFPDKCPVFGIEFVFNPGTHPVDASPSVDRTIPKLGYVPGNVVVMSRKANQTKSNSSIDEMRIMLAYMESVVL